MNCHILITGANGQLGREMQKVLSCDEKYHFFATDVAELDITDKSAIDRFVENNEIKYIVNCAAYTAVDKAEDDEKLCKLLNVDAPTHIASVAEKCGAKLIHISTDYVFDGKNYKPYKETDTPCPQSVYGMTKLAGEKGILEKCPDAIIIRTSWLYSPHGKNFVKTMLELGRTRENLNVVSDQIGTPTFAGDLAQAIYEIIRSERWLSGIYHFSNEGACSWYDFTKIIHHIAGIKSCEVDSITSDKYPAKASRPFYSVLDKSKIKETYGIKIPYWIESLEKCIAILEADNNK